MSETFALSNEGVDPLLRDGLPRDAHAGLYWTHYLPVGQGPRQRPGLVERAKPVLEPFARQFNARGEGARNAPRDLLRQHRERMQRALDHRRAVLGWRVERVTATVSWRLVTGLGSAQPLEVNLAFDPLIGVPYLPGPAVKGLCRRAADALDRPLQETERLFGPDLRDSSAKPARATVTFFDAFPTRWPRIELDVMNPHHPEYTAGHLTEPVETESPVPVYFLAVGAGVEFVFPVAAPPGHRADVDQALELLEAGLTQLGIGGKTAVGYGVMQAAGGASTALQLFLRHGAAGELAMDGKPAAGTGSQGQQRTDRSRGAALQPARRGR